MNVKIRTVLIILSILMSMAQTGLFGEGLLYFFIGCVIWFGILYFIALILTLFFDIIRSGINLLYRLAKKFYVKEIKK